jgi:hypothetical protein
MKANELRIGNLLNKGDLIESFEDGTSVLIKKGSVIKVNSISGKGINNYIDDYGHCPVSEWYDLKGYSPIPLTEGWLLKLGFTKERDTVFEKIIINNRLFTIIQHGFTKTYTYPSQNSVTSIQHVHQLQNLYFALTGKELEIK